MQAASYTHQLLRVVVAQICQTIGWQSVTATSLEIMIDILDRYIREVCRVTHDYAEHCKYLFWRYSKQLYFSDCFRLSFCL